MKQYIYTYNFIYNLSQKVSNGSANLCIPMSFASHLQFCHPGDSPAPVQQESALLLALTNGGPLLNYKGLS